MTTIINASPTNGLQMTSDGSGVCKVQSNGVTTNALAWVSFNGATGAIYSSYNIASVTRSGLGYYGIAFTNAMVNTSYVAVTNVGYGIPLMFSNLAPGYEAPTTGYFKMLSMNTALNNQYDSPYICVAVFGN